MFRSSPATKEPTLVSVALQSSSSLSLIHAVCIIEPFLFFNNSQISHEFFSFSACNSNGFEWYCCRCSQDDKNSSRRDWKSNGCSRKRKTKYWNILFVFYWFFLSILILTLLLLANVLSNLTFFSVISILFVIILGLWEARYLRQFFVKQKVAWFHPWLYG